MCRQAPRLHVSEQCSFAIANIVMTTSKVGAIPIHGDHGASSLLAVYATHTDEDTFTRMPRRLGFTVGPRMLHKFRIMCRETGGVWAIDDPESVSRDEVFCWQIAKKLNTSKKLGAASKAYYVFDHVLQSNADQTTSQKWMRSLNDEQCDAVRLVSS